MNHPCVCRAWRPVSLERRVLVIKGNQHIALASASGKREVHFGLMCIQSSGGKVYRLLGIKRLICLLTAALKVVVCTGTYCERISSEQEILEGLQDQKVCVQSEESIRRDGQVVNTKHLILTFACPDLPQFITAGYLRCSVCPYIPNPLRCFQCQCQRFGHSKTTCHGKPTCARCSEVGHDSGECNGQEKCINCKGDHPSYSRSCNTWKLEKEIITVKIKNRLTYPEARLAVTNRTPIQGFSYVAVAKKITTSSGTQTSPVTIIDNSKEKTHEQPSQKHSPRKDNKKKLSRRRKTSQTSDAMDTDVNPSDTDYVIGQASEEDEPLRGSPSF
ncbi:uncharacterized protein TNCV_4328311 [Trichonephila clavipes]|nr:uncharacterized protein TNCV_4328311 [Trichonephila clavipes]